jgi:tetratricopeptide (TPR) repeat protein
MPPGQIAQEIKSDLDFLAGTYQDLPERHRSLRATFEHSYRLLNSQEQQALCRLTIFPGSFDRFAAEKIAEATLAVLSSLSDRSLLEYIRIENHGSRNRYGMHELIKQFSSEKLAQHPAEVERTKDLHRSFYMSFLNDRNRKVMGGLAQYEAGQEVSGEIENVRMALERAIGEGNLDELGHSLNVLMYSYEILGLFDEAERLFGKISRCIEEGIQKGEPAGEAADYFLGRAIMYHGWYCMRLARFDHAIELTQKGLALSKQFGELEGYGLALNSLGVIARIQGKYPQSKNYLEAGSKSFRQQVHLVEASTGIWACSPCWKAIYHWGGLYQYVLNSSPCSRTMGTNCSQIQQCLQYGI